MIPTPSSKARKQFKPTTVKRAFQMRLGGIGRETKIIWAFLGDACHVGEPLARETTEATLMAVARRDLLTAILNIMDLTEADLREIMADVGNLET